MKTPKTFRKFYYSLKPVDWRKILKDEEDPDDEELEKTPADVLAILGFDPKDQ